MKVINLRHRGVEALTMIKVGMQMSSSLSWICVEIAMERLSPLVVEAAS